MTNSVMSSQSAEWGDESHVVTELKRDRGSTRLVQWGCWMKGAGGGTPPGSSSLSTWFYVFEEFGRVFLSVPFQQQACYWSLTL